MTNLNLLGSYIWKRIQKENPMRSRTHPREYLTGLFINAKDIQRYIYDYVNYGIDYTGDDNICTVSAGGARDHEETKTVVVGDNPNANETFEQMCQSWNQMVKRSKI